MTKSSKLELSFSKCQVFLGCRKQYRFIYEEDLVPITAAIPLQVGDIVHWLREKFVQNELTSDMIAGLPDFIQESYPSNEPDLSHDIAVQAATLMRAYIEEFEQSDYRIISPEMHLEKDYGDFILYSRLDGLLEDAHKNIWRDEVKTAARMDSRYLQGYRKGLQTGIAHWLMDDILDFKAKGTVFEMIIKTQIPQVKIVPVSREPWRIEYAKETVHGIVRSINRGDFYPSMACDRWNRSCDYEILCRNDSPANRKAFFTSRSEQKERKLNRR